MDCLNIIITALIGGIAGWLAVRVEADFRAGATLSLLAGINTHD
jgi:uncharacterized membrane protein YeaQ/YmgE (transglycosylase-associated protein family)